MNREELIKKLEEEIPKKILKCRFTKIRFIQIYRLGKLYIDSEVYRRLTGKEYNISMAYFTY